LQRAGREAIPKAEDRQRDVSEMTRKLTKVAMERILEIEMEEHLREKKNGRRPSGNS